MILFCPSFGDSSMERADLRLLSDKRNLIFTMYDYYAGEEADGYFPNGALNHQYNGGTGKLTSDGTTGYTSGTFAELEQHLLVNLRVMRAAGIPMWIGAVGINSGAPGAQRWAADKMTLFRKYGIGYAWWLYTDRDAFAVLDGSGRFKPIVNALL